MAKANGNDLPFLVAGGGIGGLIAAFALARKGFPVRVFEQAPEFKELGAGIQLGPNIFRAIERVGLKDGMLDDAWRAARASRCATRSAAASSPAFRSARLSCSASASPMR